MKSKSKMLKLTRPMLLAEYGPELTEAVMAQAEDRFARLCAENAGEPKAVKMHTVQKIYPAIALFEALVQQGKSRREAAGFLDRCICAQAQPQADSIRLLLKLPGMYRLWPAMFKWSAKNNFGPKAGFAARYYDTPKTQVKFDMTKCLFCDTCKKYGCPEIIVCFCHTDDVCSRDIHPRLCWNRTKIMGEGADCCDFDLKAE